MGTGAIPMRRGKPLWEKGDEGTGEVRIRIRSHVQQPFTRQQVELGPRGRRRRGLGLGRKSPLRNSSRGRECHMPKLTVRE